jgi:tyrosine-protein kinase Etk/Wzc
MLVASLGFIGLARCVHKSIQSALSVRRLQRQAWREMLSRRAINRATLLWRRREVIVSAALAGLLLCTSICCFLPRQYESTSRLMPANGIPEIAILQSRTVQDALINELYLEKVYRDHVIEDAREDLQKHTTVSENARNGIITIVVTDRNADRAMAMDRDYAAELNRIVIAMARKSAQGDRIYLQQQLVRTSAELKIAESKAGVFASTAMVADPEEKLRAAIRGEVRLEDAINSRQAELQSLRADYTDESPDVRIVKAQVSELKRDLNEFIGKQVPVASDRPLNVTTTPLREIPFVAARYDDFNRLVASKEGIALALNEKYQAALLREASDVPPIAVLDEPTVSLVRSWPLCFGILFLGTCLSVSLASVYAIIDHETRQTFPAKLEEAALPATPTPS